MADVRNQNAPNSHDPSQAPFQCLPSEATRNVYEHSLKTTMQNKKTHPSSKKWSWRKPKGKPKRPLSAYNIFYQEVRQQILEERRCRHDAGMSGIGFRNLTAAVAAKWKELDSTLKRPYELKAREAKAQYLVDLSLWEKTQLTQDSSPTFSSQKSPEGCESSGVPSLISVLYDASHHSSNVDERKESTSRTFASINRPMAPNPFLSNEPAIDALLASACDLYSEYGSRGDHAFGQQPQINTPFESNARKLSTNYPRFPPNTWQDMEGNFVGDRYQLAASGNDIYEPLPLHHGPEFNRVTSGNLDHITRTSTSGPSIYFERLPEERLDPAGSTALEKLLINMLDNDESVP